MHNSTGKANVSLSTMAGLVTYAGADSIPSGVSPRCHDVDFEIGSVKSRKGTRNVYSFADLLATNPGSAASSSTWSNPSNAFSTSLYTTASGVDSGTLDITQFALSVAEPVVGIEVTLNAQCNTSAIYTLSLIQDGVVIGTPKIIAPGMTLVVGGSADLWGASPNVNDTTFGVRIEATSEFPLASYFLNNVAITVYLANSGSNFQYIKSVPFNDGTLRTLALDSQGEMWVENVNSAPGVLSPLFSIISPGSYAKSVTALDREYIAFSDLSAGTDIPRQYTGDWVDRVTQVGPGAPPQFTAQAYSGDNYAITTITQPTAQNRGSSYFLRSTGPGSTSAGNVITFYYSDLNAGGTADNDLVTAFNSGNPVILWVSFDGSGIATYGPHAVRVTSIGLASPPGQPHQFYYFTFQDPEAITTYTYYKGSTSSSYTAHYQRSLATVTTSIPVPGLVVGNQITIAGSSISSYNNTWTVTQALNSGSMVITQTSVTSGVATYSYALSSGVAPAAGEQVTITGTTNANGNLNGNGLTIVSATGGSTGSFTVNVSLADFPNAVESGQAVTAGTIFTFDPGASLPLTSPIYGNATGGNLVFGGNSQFVSPGTRQGVVFFGTRNGAETQPSIPVVFTIPSNTNTILASMVPIGPPNTTYRQIAITEAGQLGIPGENFYTIDDPVTYVVNGVTYQSTSFRINDNTTTSIALTFRDSDLLSARPIDQQGEDLFNQIEIGNPAWITQYAGRTFYGLTQTTIDNFVNLSFDGGYNPSTTKQPLGWTIVGNGGSLIVSPEFGNSYYIQNSTGISKTSLGLITQSAARDYYGVQIIRPNVAYSARVTARIPSGLTKGNLVLSFTSAGVTLSSYTIPFANLSTTLQTLTGAVFSALGTIPADLALNVQATGIANEADIEIERIQFFPTSEPVSTTELLVSYVDNPEGVDVQTGAVQTNSENTQPCYGAVVMYDLLYLLKDRSMYYTQDSSGDEPDAWGVHEVSNKAGACGVNAYDSGEEWIVMANRNGVYVFTGGEPRKISQEIQQIWDAIDWSLGKSIWVRNDVNERKIYIGIPLPTPNPWLPDAPAIGNVAVSSNLLSGLTLVNPLTSPNVVLVCDYEGQSSGSGLSDAAPIEDTFYGDLLGEDMKRKWTLWQIPSPYADFITQANGSDTPLLYGNGLGNSKIYITDATNDDGAEIPWRYVTYGFGSDKDAKNAPVLGNGRKRWSLWRGLITGAGKCLINFLEDNINSSVPIRNQYSLTLDQNGDLRGSSSNATGNLVYVEYKSGEINAEFNLSQMQMVGRKDVFNSDFVRD